MPSAAVPDTKDRDQPKFASIGTISTLGAARSPAATSSARKVTAITTKA